jgi:hypothetical protein
VLRQHRSSSAVGTDSGEPECEDRFVHDEPRVPCASPKLASELQDPSAYAPTVDRWPRLLFTETWLLSRAHGASASCSSAA